MRWPIEETVRAARMAAEAEDLTTADLTMVECRLDDGQHLLALNEIYIGHQSHQSSPDTFISTGAHSPSASSSGVIVATGTGATGWARSISRETETHS